MRKREEQKDMMVNANMMAVMSKLLYMLVDIEKKETERWMEDKLAADCYVYIY